MKLFPVGSLLECAHSFPQPLLCSLHHAAQIAGSHTVFFIPVELVPWMTLALIATHCVDANLLAASVVDAALVGVSTVGEAIESVSSIAGTRKCTRVVDAAVVTGPFQRTFIHILARLLVC